jgi:hypothetical protein
MNVLRMIQGTSLFKDHQLFEEASSMLNYSFMERKEA